MASATADNARLAEEYYARHSRTVFHICLRLGCGNVAWAEDMTHETFIRLLEARDAIDVSGSVGGWLCTVAYRLCLDRLKHERTVWSRVRARLSVEPKRPSESPERALLLSREASEVMQVLKSLPPKERAVVVMRFIDEMEQKQIAKVLGHSEGYISKLLTKASRVVRATGWELPNA